MWFLLVVLGSGSDERSGRWATWYAAFNRDEDEDEDDENDEEGDDDAGDDDGLDISGAAAALEGEASLGALDSSVWDELQASPLKLPHKGEEEDDDVAAEAYEILMEALLSALSDGSGRTFIPKCAVPVCDALAVVSLGSFPVPSG